MGESSDVAPVVLMHGWPVTTSHWRHLLPALRAAGFDPVAVTLPGLGSSAGTPCSYRKADLARSLSAELTRRGITRFALVGHDWGGTVAALMAAAMPAAVSALVLEEEILPGVDVAIPAPGNAHYPSWHGPFNRAPGLAEQLVPGREEAYYGTFLRQSAGPAGLDPATVRAYIDAYAAPGVLQAGLGYYRARADDDADVRRLRAHPLATPILAIGGRHAMGTAVAEGLCGLAVDVTGVMLDASGHYPVEQEPAPAARAVVEFLREHRRTSTG